MKKVISIIMVLAMMLGLLPAYAQAAEILESGTCGDNIKWELDEDWFLKITGTGEIPYDMYLNDCGMFTARIEIGEGITGIGDGCFSGFDSLQSITIPSTVTYIDGSAFFDCWNLTDIQIAGDNQNYYVSEGGELMSKDSTQLIFVTNLKSGDYTVPDTVRWIDRSAFGGTGFTTIVIPAGVEEIEDNYLSIHKSNGTYWPKSDLKAFQVDSENPNYSSDEHGVLFNKDKTALYEAPYALGRSYTVPDGVETIGTEAFRGCDDGTPGYPHTLEFTLPESLKAIGERAFAETGLREIHLPSKVESVEGAFIDADGLKNITVSEDNPYLRTDKNIILYGDGGSKIIWVPSDYEGELVLSKKVTGAAKYAFGGSSRVDSVIFMADNVKLDSESFYGFNYVKRVYLLGDSFEIARDAFDPSKKSANKKSSPKQDLAGKNFTVGR